VRKLRILFIILGTALACRLAVLIAVWGNNSAVLGDDSWSYMEPAKNLLNSGAFWRGNETTGQAEIMRTPGYPIFLLLCGLGQNFNYGFAQIAQVGLGVLIVYLTYLLGARLVNPTAGLWAAALQSVSIGSMLTSVWILSECLFSFLIAVALLLLVRHFQEGTWWLVPIAAVIIAAATYVRPIGVMLVPVVVAVLLYRPRRWTTAAEFAVIFAALVVPWYVRNHMVGYDGFSSVGDQNLLWYEAPGVQAKIEGIPVKQAQQELKTFHSQKLQESNLRPDSGPAMKLGGEIAKKIILAHPWVWVRVHLITSLNAMLPASTGLLQALGITSGYKGTLALLQSEGLGAAVKSYFGGNLKAVFLMIPELLLLVIQYGLCGVFGFWMIRRYKLDWGRAGWLMTLTVLVFIFVTGPPAMPRFRVPVEPLLSVGAAAGLMLLTRWRRERAAGVMAPVFSHAADNEPGYGPELGTIAP
jgi:4-amino-4-deoxy-L-arabinose transferase-like glycosyltransferase